MRSMVPSSRMNRARLHNANLKHQQSDYEAFALSRTRFLRQHWSAFAQRAFPRMAEVNLRQRPTNTEPRRQKLLAQQEELSLYARDASAWVLTARCSGHAYRRRCPHRPSSQCAPQTSSTRAFGSDSGRFAEHRYQQMRRQCHVRYESRESGR